MELLLSAVGEAAITALLANEAVAVASTCCQAHRALAGVSTYAWAVRPSFCLGEPQITAAALGSALASLPGGSAAARRWPVCSRAGAKRCQGAVFCCWPLLRLALKRQHVATLPGACLGDAQAGVICLWLQSQLEREPREAPGWQVQRAAGELTWRVDLLGVVAGGSLLLLRHQLLTLDNCRGSPDSPAGLEHAPQAVIAPNWQSLARFLGRTAPRWLDEVRNATGISGDSPDGDDCGRKTGLGDALEDTDSEDEAAAWTYWGEAPWVSILCPEPLIEMADEFLGGLPIA